MRRFSNIVLIVGADSDNAQALQRATALAKNSQAALTVCAVVDALPDEMHMIDSTITPEELCDIAVAEQREQLDPVLEKIAEEEIAVDAKVLVGKPFIEIVRQVLVGKHDLVIKSAEGATRLKATLFGSTDMHLMRKCPCPVWIIKSNEHSHYRRILAAVDRDPEGAVKDVLNRQILEIATSLAIAEFSELHVVHAWRLFAESFYRSPRVTISDADVDAMVTAEAGARARWLENLVNTYGAKADKAMVDYLEPQLHVVKGDAKHVVPAKARELDADLIVMGTVARTGVAGFFMGNTAENILNQIDCSVLTVKPPGFVSPITVAE